MSINTEKSFGHVDVRKFVTCFRILLISEDKTSLLAVSDQKNTPERLLELQKFFPKKLTIKVVTPMQFQTWIEHLFQDTSPNMTYTAEESNPLGIALENIFKKAVRLNASDISLETYDQNFKLTFRVDGEWSKPEFYPSEYGKTILARIRALAHLNPGKFLNVQESHFEITLDGSNIQFRLSEIATVSGSNMVLRVFYENHSTRTIDTLGMPNNILNPIKELLLNPFGLLLATGPTGSGKTTTLYNFLRYLTTESKKIITVEDPIEFPLKDIIQTEVTPQTGFAPMLKALLRQDPDILMLGEIRDEETASVATQAALTGHFVLSTVHSKSTIDVIWRMLELKVEKFLLASALTGILSQRLIKNLPSGRKAIFEWLPIGENLKQAITSIETHTYESLLAVAHNNGFISF